MQNETIARPSGEEDARRLVPIVYALEQRIADRQEWLRADAGISPEFYPGNPEEEENAAFDDVLLIGLYERLTELTGRSYSPKEDEDLPEYMYDDMSTKEWVEYMASGYGHRIKLQFYRGRVCSVDKLVTDFQEGRV